MADLNNGLAYTESTFYRKFERDIKHAKQSIEIVSPYITQHRGGPVLELLRQALRRNVAVSIYTKPLQELDENMRAAALAMFPIAIKYGIEVFQVDELHQKFAFIDDQICWEGSLNILSHRKSHEHMRRLSSTQIVCGNRKRANLSQLRAELDLECPQNGLPSNGLPSNGQTQH